MQTKITGGSPKVYIMMLEVVSDNENNENIWQEALKKTAKDDLQEGKWFQKDEWKLKN